jgi:MscS family membrane protein
MLAEDPAVESGSSRLRVTSFAGAAFELELFAFVKTGDFGKFTAFRQEILLKIVGIVEASGTRFAAPTRLLYQPKDPGFFTDKASDIAGQGTELPADNAFRQPGKVQAASQ